MTSIIGNNVMALKPHLQTHAVAAVNADTIVDKNNKEKDEKAKTLARKLNQLAQQLLQDIATVLEKTNYAGQKNTDASPASIQPVSANPTSSPSVDSILGELENGLVDISEIMMKIADLIKQIRNIMQNYNAKQQAQEWSIKVAALSKKLDSIKETYKSDLISGIVGVCGAVVGGGLGMGGAAKGLVSLSELGNVATRGADSAAKVGVSGITRDSQYDTMQSDLDNANFDAYRQTESQLLDKAHQQSQSLVKGLESFVGLINQMLSAVKY